MIKILEIWLAEWKLYLLRVVDLHHSKVLCLAYLCFFWSLFTIPFDVSNKIERT